jgi:putative phosphonate metabolism protein
MSARYAIYFAPAPDTRWWTFGCEWLGYDPLACTAVRQRVVPDVPADVFANVTLLPFRYGFHATLKAPMCLADGTTEHELLGAVAGIAAGREPFALPRLRVGRLGGFLACVPESRDERVHALADDCVRELDRFRAPPPPDEVARRRAKGLSAAQAALLERWGYPYVFDEFRFHLTLTGPLDGVLPQVEIAVTEAAQADVDALDGEPLLCDALCVFRQIAPQGPFRLWQRLPFG